MAQPGKDDFHITVSGHKKGPPSKLKPEMMPVIKELYENGATHQEVADFIGVSRMTLWRWITSYPLIRHVAVTAREVACDRAEDALIQKALGMTVTETRWAREYPRGEDGKLDYTAEPEMVVVSRVEKQLPPDPQAALAFLKAYRKGVWGDVKDEEMVTIDLGEVNAVELTRRLGFLARLEKEEQKHGQTDSEPLGHDESEHRGVPPRGGKANPKRARRNDRGDDA